MPSDRFLHHQPNDPMTGDQKEEVDQVHFLLIIFHPPDYGREKLISGSKSLVQQSIC
jgi:hypothetical protein